MTRQFGMTDSCRRPHRPGRRRFAGMVVAVALISGFPSLEASPPLDAPANTELDLTIDWKEMELSVTAVAPLQQDSAKAAYELQTRLRNVLPRAAQQALYDIPVRSDARGVDFIKEDHRYAERLADPPLRSQARPPQLNRTLDEATVAREYPLIPDVLRLFVPHERPRPMRRVIGWRPGGDFTGLVIDARGELPVHGEDRASRAYPLLAPRIFDDRLAPVLRPDMVDPEALERWGVVGYGSDPTSRTHRERIGDRPMQIAATGLFGIRPGNPQIAEEDAERLLANENLRNLLYEGRVLILVDDNVLVETL